MTSKYTIEQTFTKQDFTKNPLPKGVYENCTFIQCDFSQTDLSDVKLEDCEMEGCNWSMVKLHNTALRNVNFIACKLLGLRWEDCNQFALVFSFENCMLDHSSFFQMKIKGTNFKDCSLQEVDFSNCDISSCTLQNCDLKRAIFDNTVMEKTDFRTSFNYSIDLSLNKTKKTKFSKDGIIGLLDKYDIEIED